MSRAAVGVLVSFLLQTGVADAQTARRSQRPRPPRPEVAEIRAEYAAVLLQSGRYDQAAAEYRKIIATEPQNREHRLGLAQALAWGGHPREAERELADLVRGGVATDGARELLRSVRESMEPRVKEAARWVAQEPGYPPYRLALARALVRENRPQAARAHYDKLLALGHTVSLLREAAGARSAARDHRGAVILLRRALELASGDTALRRSYAQALSAAGDYAAGIREYDAMIASNADAELVLERGRLHAWRRDYTRAEQDFHASLQTRPSAEAQSALGDLYRWQGDGRKARSAYEAALRLQPKDRSARAGLTQLAREEAPIAPVATDAPGWLVQGDYIEDNSGFLYLATQLRGARSLGSDMVASVGVEGRRVSDRAQSPELHTYGLGVDGGVSRSFRHGAVAFRGGTVMHEGMDPILTGSATAAIWLGRVRVAFDARVEPAYQSLMAAGALRESTQDESTFTHAITSTENRLAVSVPLGNVWLDVGAGRMWLSDGNRRESLFGTARYPLTRGLSLLYATSALAFRERSVIYWDPLSYMSHAIGLDVGSRADIGFGYIVRVLPGIARTKDVELTSGDFYGEPETRYTLQLSADGEVAYTRDGWQLAAGGGYGRGREGGYQRYSAHLRVGIIP